MIHFSCHFSILRIKLSFYVKGQFCLTAPQGRGSCLLLGGKGEKNQLLSSFEKKHCD